MPYYSAWQGTWARFSIHVYCTTGTFVMFQRILSDVMMLLLEAEQCFGSHYIESTLGIICSFIACQHTHYAVANPHILEYVDVVKHMHM